MQPQLYQKISATYFFYYLFVGSFVPYWGIYLKDLNFSVWDIALLITLLQIGRIIAPPLWGWITDYSGKNLPWLWLNSVLGILGFVLVFWTHSFWGIFWIMLSISVFTSSIQPLIENITLAHLGLGDSHHYGRLRVWGSLGFIAASIVLGLLIDNTTSASVPWFMLAVQVGLFFIILPLPEPPPPHHLRERLNIWQVLKEPNVIALLLACSLMVTAHGALYNFYSIYLSNKHYSNSMIGVLWTIGVISEILMFVAMPNIMRVLRLKTILIISLVLGVVRFSLIGWAADSLGWLIFAQTLHAATFASFHAATIEIIAQFFRDHNRARGQTIYNSVAYGVGGTLGGIGGGYAFQQWGGETTFLLAALCPLLGFLVIVVGLKLKQGHGVN